MNTNIKNYLLGILVLLTGISYAQDNDRMKRDIEVAENILSTLMDQEFGLHGNNVEGTYIEGHGAMFTIYGGVLSNLALDRQVILPPTWNEDGVYRLGKTTDKPINLDSLNNALRTKTKEAMKIFITDYAQLLSQPKPDEKVHCVMPCLGNIKDLVDY
ncbi:MAG: hypothetical protein IPJ74_25350 [Saprospiraceae bacterium]|nr:hypothetical protein [Saprospiraceae bacterium]